MVRRNRRHVLEYTPIAHNHYCPKTKRSGDAQLIRINKVKRTLNVKIPKMEGVERNLKKEDMEYSKNSDVNHDSSLKNFIS